MLRDSDDIIQRLKREGYRLVTVRGSHHKFYHSGRKRTVIVVHPRRDIPIGTVGSIYRQAGGRTIECMTHYIALIHKDADSSYGASFPDVPGVITAGDTLDEAIARAAEVLA